MSSASPLTWVVESAAFASGDEPLRSAAARAGHAVVEWDDAWWADGGWPRLAGRPVVFHGSLGNAARVRAELPWRPGAFCDVEAFRCSAWYERARRWLVHERWLVLPADVLAADPRGALAPLGSPDAVFVRPDSPLKPFAGRVLARERISLAALDHGFYYDDPSLPVVVAPVRAIGREWRYVVAGQRVIAGSAYAAAGRAPLPDVQTGEPWRLAAAVAAALAPPEAVYVMDVCEADGDLRLLELNPFGGADLYACDADAVVAALAASPLTSSP
jgi:hypothetical protein